LSTLNSLASRRFLLHLIHIQIAIPKVRQNRRPPPPTLLASMISKDTHATCMLQSSVLSVSPEQGLLDL
jgi:hypothetical protein